MNFYKHHLGDYDGAAAHLSWDEDMAYTRLLRAYYRRELPIPAEQAYRLARASTASQRKAVDSVLREFFYEDAGTWRNKRADEEIEEYQAKSEKNRQIGKLGGRPRETQTVSTDNPNANQTVSKNNPSHKPLAISQEPERAKAQARKRAAPLPEGFGISERVKKWAEGKGYERLEDHLESFKGKCVAKGYTYVDWDEAFMGAIRDDWAKLRLNSAPDYSSLMKP